MHLFVNLLYCQVTCGCEIALQSSSIRFVCICLLFHLLNISGPDLLPQSGNRSCLCFKNKSYDIAKSHTKPGTCFLLC